MQMLGASRHEPPARGIGGRFPALLASFVLVGAIGSLVVIGLARHGGHARLAQMHSQLIYGKQRGAFRPSQLDRADHVARAFAASYASFMYRAVPSYLRFATAKLDRALTGTQVSVPPTKIGLRPRVTGLQLHAESQGSVLATATIADGSSPPFALGFTVGKRGSRWIVTALAGSE